MREVGKREEGKKIKPEKKGRFNAIHSRQTHTEGGGTSCWIRNCGFIGRKKKEVERVVTKATPSFCPSLFALKSTFFYIKQSNSFLVEVEIFEKKKKRKEKNAASIVREK